MRKPAANMPFPAREKNDKNKFFTLPIIATVLSVLALAALIVYAALPAKKAPENA